MRWQVMVLVWRISVLLSSLLLCSVCACVQRRREGSEPVCVGVSSNVIGAEVGGAETISHRRRTTLVPTRCRQTSFSSSHPCEDLPGQTHTILISLHQSSSPHLAYGHSTADSPPSSVPLTLASVDALPNRPSPRGLCRHRETNSTPPRIPIPVPIAPARSCPLPTTSSSRMPPKPSQALQR
jgi:hypothetical protein